MGASGQREPTDLSGLSSLAGSSDLSAYGGARTGQGRHDLRLVPAALVVWAATLAGLLWGWLACALVSAVAVIVAVVLAWRAFGRGETGVGQAVSRRISAAGAVVVCGLLALGPSTARLYEADHDPLRDVAADGRTATLRAEIAERPRPLRTDGYGDRQSGVRSVLVPTEVVAVTVDGRRVPSSGRVLLIAPAERWPGLLPGQRVTAQGELAPAERAELTVAVAYVRGPPDRVTAPSWWQRSAESVRAALRGASTALGQDEAGLLPGLVVGDTTALPSRVEEEFLDAGLSHLMAVSGSNVAIVCGAVLLLARGLRAGPRLSATVAGVVLIAFVGLVGYEPSVLRAGVMGAVGLLALVLGRRRSTVPALAGAVALLILYDPAMATSMGFTLSAVATAGLVFMAPRWSEAMARRHVPRGVADALAVPVAAFLATAPVIAGMAGEVSVVSSVANLLAAPVVAPVTVLGVAAAALALPWPAAANVLVHMAEPGLWWLVFVARQAAGVPGAVVSWPSGWWGGLLAVVVVVVLVLSIRLRGTRLVLAAVLAAAVAVAVPVHVISPGWPPADWAVVACDVGQGDGLVLATGEPGRAVVVDSGPDPAALEACLDRLGIDRIPLAVLSHLHADHVGGLDAVFTGRSVGGVAVGPGRTPEWAWRDVVTTAEEQSVPLVQLSVGQRLEWSSLTLEVLGPQYVPPPESATEGEGAEVNDLSLVLRADTPAGRVLLTGDAELAAQSDLLAHDVDPRAEILKVPHHGARTTLPEFLAAVRPRVALVSVGADNGYGHPNGTTLRRLTSEGALIARTDTGGDIAVVPDGRGPVVVRRGASS